MINGWVFAIAALVLLALVPPLAAIGWDLEKTFNEGWNAYHAARVAAGEPLYTNNPALIVNYPLLSFYLIAWLKPWFGSVLMIGRWLNLGAFAATGLLVALIVRRLGGGAVDALFAAACTLGFQAVQASDWIATDEPQMLAQALMLAGLLCYVSGPPVAKRLVICALLFAAGGFTKQILPAIPLAVTADLLWKNRRGFVVWCLCGIAALSIFVLASQLLTGSDAWLQIFSQRIYSWHHIIYLGRKFLIHFKFTLLIAIIFLAQRLPEHQKNLLRSMGFFVLAESVIFSAGDGISANIYLELTVFLGMIAGLALAWWRKSFRERRRAVPVGAMLAMAMALPLATRAHEFISDVTNLRAAQAFDRNVESETRLAVVALAEIKGEVFCEDLLLCQEAGKPSALDAFSLHSQIALGRFDEAMLIRDVSAHRFAAIELGAQIHPFPDQPERFAPYLLNQQRFTINTLNAIDRHYQPVFISSRAVLYVPRSETR